MKKLAFLLIVVAVLMALFTAAVYADPVMAKLIAGQNEHVGWVVVRQQGEDLIVRIWTKDDFCLNETHVHVVTDFADIPQNDGGPIPGHFDYKGEHECADVVRYKIPLEWDPGDELIVVAHAVVGMHDDCDPYYDPYCEPYDETGWGVICGKIDLYALPGSNWATYIPYTVQQPEPELVVDQENDPVADWSFGCGDTGWSLYQSFTPAASPLAAVQLRLRAGGSFPEAGVNTTINIRSADPTGAVLGTATAFVPGPQDVGTQLLVDFGFSLPVSPGDTLVIEWLSVAGPGQPSDTILSWMGRIDNPYPGGNMFSCAGAPYPDRDLNFRTFTQ